MKTELDTRAQARAQAKGTDNFRENLVVLVCPCFVYVYLCIFLL